MLRESLLDDDLDTNNEISDDYVVSNVGSDHFGYLMTKSAKSVKANPILDKKCNMVSTDKQKESYEMLRGIIYEILKLPTIIVYDEAVFNKYIKQIVSNYVRKNCFKKIKVSTSKSGDKNLYIYVTEGEYRTFVEETKDPKTDKVTTWYIRTACHFDIQLTKK